MKDELQQAREKIAETDQKIAKLFEERMRAVERVASYKRERGLPVYDGAREEELIAKNSALVSDDLRPYYVNYQRDVMRVSRAYQTKLLEGIRIAFCGEVGAFAYFTAKELFPDGNCIPKGSFAEAYEAVERGECDVCVLPIENSFAGEVGQATDLMFSGNLHITEVHDTAVDQALLGVKGSTLADVKKVVSHPQALAQCATYLAKKGWEKEEAPSTSSASHFVATANDKSIASVGCAQSAELFGLTVLDKNINESRANTTRFAVFAPVENNMAGDRDTDGFSLVFTVKNEAGALAKALSVVGKAGFNMRTLRSRPRKELVWNYYFYLEAEGALHGEAGEKMLAELKQYCDRLKVVGVYR